MLSFAYSANGGIWKKINHLVFGKHNGKIKVSSTSQIILNVLNDIRFRNVCMRLRV